MYSFQSVNRVAHLSGRNPFAVMLAQMKNDPHSPFYYFTVYLFSKYCGDGFALRLLSVMASLSTCLLFFYFSTLFLDTRGSIIALGLLAIHPLHIWYAQEARMYALVTFLVLIMATVYVLALRTGKTRYWILFPVVTLVTLWASYFTVFLLIGTGLVLLIPENRRYLKKWTFGVSGILATLLLLWPVFLSQFNFVKNSFWIPQPTVVTLFLTEMVFNQGFSATCSQYSWGLVIFSSLFVLGILSLFREDPQKACILFIFVAVPLSLAYLVSRHYVPIYIHRQLIVFSPFYYIGITRGLEKTISRRSGIPVFLLALLLLLGGLRNYYNGYMFPHTFRADLFGGVYPKKQYRPLFVSLEKSFSEGDGLISGDLQSYILLRAYLDKKDAPGKLAVDKLIFVFAPQYVFQYDQRYMGVDDFVKALPDSKLKDLYAYQILAGRRVRVRPIGLNDINFKRVWLLTSSWEVDRSLGMDAEMLQSRLMQTYILRSSDCRDGFCIDLLTR